MSRHVSASGKASSLSPATDPSRKPQGFAPSSACAVTGWPVASAPAEIKQGVLAVNDLEVSERIMYHLYCPSSHKNMIKCALHK